MGTETPELRGSAEDVNFFELMDNHMPRVFLRVMRHLPSDPRCRLCNAPYGGIGREDHATRRVRAVA